MITDPENPYYARQQAEIKRLTTLSRAIALALGGPWKAEPVTEEWRFEIAGPDGAKIFGSTTWKRGRLELVGLNPRTNFPSSSGSLSKRHAITVAPDAAPDRIAGEIKRRLLPGYLPDYADALRRLQDHEDEEQRCCAIARELGEVWKHSPCEGYLACGVQTYGKFRVSSPDSVRLELDVDPDTARQIVAILFARKEG